jgi:hypothetical protein
MQDFLSQQGRELVALGTYDKLTVTHQTDYRGFAHDNLFTVPVVNPVAAWSCLAALYLWNDALDQAHEIVQKSPEDLLRSAPFLHQTPRELKQKVGLVQSVENAKAQKPQQLEDMTPTLAFWHAIMHRREGDFSNSKYWYARCRHHPVLARIPALAREMLGEAAASTAPLHNIVTGTWDPEAFVDVVEAVHRKPGDPLHDAAARLQQVEWRALFDHCVRNSAA